MFNVFSDIVKLIFKFLFQQGPPWIVFSIILILLIWFLIYPEKAEKCASLLCRLFAFVSYNISRKYISLNIQGEINGRIRDLNKEVRGALPYRMKIKWVKAEEIEAEVRDGNVIVIMRDYKNQSINIAHAALAYTCKGLLPKARDYVQPTLMKSVDYIVARKLVKGNVGALNYLTTLFEEESSKNPKLKKWMGILAPIDERGFVTRIIIFDFKDLGEFLSSCPTNDVRRETAEYVKLVHRFVTKEPEGDVNPSFNKKYLHIAITPIAGAKIISIDPHLNFIKRSLGEGITTFHVVAAGKYNIALARCVVERAEKELGLMKIKGVEIYKGFHREAKMDVFYAILRKP